MGYTGIGMRSDWIDEIFLRLQGTRGCPGDEGYNRNEFRLPARQSEPSARVQLGCIMPWVEVSDNDPGRVELFIRSAIHLCWHSLPEEKQSLDIVEGQFRRLVDRVFSNLREDADTFVQTIVDDPSSDDDEWRS